jgi:hypothetical protein
MNQSTRKQVRALKRMRLPALQARYAEVLGERTRCPNKKHLIRRITEALEAREEGGSDTGAAESGTPLSTLSVEQLQARYLEVVGRPTGSSDKRYLAWKIRQAERGLVPTGPRGRRRPDGSLPEHRVLPLRMEVEVVARFDEARERLGLGSRTELLRRSLHDHLAAAGEGEVAALLAPEA